ncbi:hypothetical protein Dalu01_02760 [Deinococcus aluminii]|uniref:Uncharacterized protein n=2 Tax=Deinococcus aluminii TaxID=1656885 RepID=A0ABP9XGA6_9DEIO
MVMRSQATRSPLTSPGRERIERDLAFLSPGQRQFFRLVIGVTRVLFVPVWLLLLAAWAARCLGLTLAAGRPAPRQALPPRPGTERLEVPGCRLYLLGAGVAVVLGLSSIIGMCFLPMITFLGAFSALQNGEGLPRVVTGLLGAAGLEGLMLLVYFRYFRDLLAGK